MAMKKGTIVILAFIAVLAIGISILVGYHEVTAATPDDATYVPGSKCKLCHSKVFKSQSETPHTKSFEILVALGEDKNPECLPCHTTGYSKPGGFTDIESTSDLTGTTCQACHGPGSAHIASGLSKEQRKELIAIPTAKACTTCHNVHGLAHEDMGSKALPYLKKKLEKLQNQIKELGG